MDVESSGSWPAIILSMIGQSVTSFLIGPPWSSEDENAIMTNLDTLPYVGLSTLIPQREAGWRMLPPVSVPMDAAQRPAATAAALPPLLPPGTLLVSHGFKVGKNAEFSVEEPIANSSMLSLPRITAPASFSFLTTVASYGGTKFSSMREAQVVLTSFVQKMSFIAMGTPVRGVRSFPSLIILSAASASFTALSRHTVMYAWIFSSTSSMRLR